VASCFRFRVLKFRIYYLQIVDFESNLMLWVGVGLMLVDYLVGQVRTNVGWFWFLVESSFQSSFFYYV